MKVRAYSDGSATVKTKPGGYGFVVLVNDKVEECGSGNAPFATNNDMELEGAIAALTAAKKIIYNKPNEFDASSTVTLVSDSEIVLGWVTGEYRFKQEDKVHRFIELQKLVNQLRVTTEWVKGHSGDQYNEECDRLANEARKALLPPEEQKPKKEKKSKLTDERKFRWNEVVTTSIWNVEKAKHVETSYTDKMLLSDPAHPEHHRAVIRVLLDLMAYEEERK